MASNVLKVFSSCALRNNEKILFSGVFKTTLISSNIHRCQYNSDVAKTVDGRSDWVVTTDDGRTIVCWHPKEEFPYECSKPIPILTPTLNEDDSDLKIQYRLDYLNRYNVFDGPSPVKNAVNLAKFTYTNKHRWFPQNGKRYRKKNPPIDREGL